MSRQIGSRGLALIKKWEGFRARRYWDAHGGVWTQGYGETQGTDNTAWTEGYASERLERRVNRNYAPAVSAAAKRYKLDLSETEFDALCSLAYNLGAGIFTPGVSTGGTMRAALATRRRRAIGAAFLVYSTAGGVRLLGLYNRRKDERTLFLTRWRRLRAYRRELRKLRRVKRPTGKQQARVAFLRNAIKQQSPNE